MPTAPLPPLVGVPLQPTNGQPMTIVSFGLLDQNVTNMVMAHQPVIEAELAQTDALTTSMLPTLPGTQAFVVEDNGQINKVDGAPVNVPGITYGYSNLSSDNVSVAAIQSGAYMITGSGNNVLEGNGGRNYFVTKGGSNNLMTDVALGYHQDTYIASMLSPTGLTSTQTDTLETFNAREDAIFRGLSLDEFNLAYANSTGPTDTLAIQLTEKNGSGVVDTILLPGHSTDDIATNRLTVGFSATPTGEHYMFIESF